MVSALSVKAIRVCKQSPLMIAIGIVIVLMNAGDAAAQAYPHKPIKIISPVSAGSAPDALARIVTQRLSENLGQNVTIENRPGAGSTIATKAAAVADPDGYTLLQVSASLAYSPVLYPNVGYDALKSFTPVATIASWSHLLIVNPGVPAASLKELIAYAKANPNQLSIGFPLAQPPQILAEMLKLESGAPINSVPYRQISQLMADLLAGRIHAFFGTGAGVVSLIQQGKLKAIAYTGVTRYVGLPEVPTVIESGFPRLALNPSDWTGIVAPAGTPVAAINALNSAMKAILGSPEIKASIARHGGEARIVTPQEFATFLVGEQKKWPPLVKAAGLVAE